MFQRVRIGLHERGLLFRGAGRPASAAAPEAEAGGSGREYLRLLGPGVHWVWGFGLHVERVSARGGAFTHPHLDELVRDPAFLEEVVVAELRDDERALVWLDGRVAHVLGPGRHVFWRGLARVEVETHRVDDQRFIHPLLGAVLQAPGARVHLLEVAVPKGHRGLLFVDERIVEELGPGRYAFWQGGARVRVQTVDMREVALEVAGQEILTKDKVSLRVNLSATYQVSDARLSVERSPDVGSALYRELQLALRQAVGGRTLDELLSAKEAVSEELRGAVEPRARHLGVALGATGIRDVILPGDMKTLLNQVIEAEKRAQANLIVRREETAATRSLLNTAKLIESSPTLLRLKELEAAERMTQSIGSIHVLGGGVDGLLEQLLPRVKD